MKHIKIFLSSTFEDMEEERDYIKNVVIPNVNNCFDIHSVKIDTVDLRWGISDDVINNHRLIKTCLSLIDHCSPFFIGILGDRYGSTFGAKDLEDTPELLNLRNSLGYDLSATELEIRHALNKMESEHSMRAIFIEKINEGKPNLFAGFTQYFHKLLLPSAARIDDKEKQAILKHAVHETVNDNLVFYKKSTYKTDFHKLEHLLFKTISESEKYKNKGKYDKFEWKHNGYFTFLLNVSTPSNPYIKDVRCDIESAYNTLVYDHSNLLLESAIAASLSEMEADNHFMYYNAGLPGSSGISTMWKSITYYLSSILSYKEQSHTIKSEKQTCINLLKQRMTTFKGSYLIIYIHEYDKLNSRKELDKWMDSVQDLNVKFILSSLNRCRDINKEYDIASLTSDEKLIFINEYLESRFSKVLQYQTEIRSLIDLPFIKLEDIISVLNYIHHYISHRYLQSCINEFAISSDIGMFYSKLVNHIRRYDSNYIDALRYLSVCQTIHKEALITLVPDLQTKWHLFNLIFEANLISSEVNRIMLVNDHLRGFLLDEMNQSAINYRKSYFEIIYSSTTPEDMEECLMLLDKIGERSLIMNYIDNNSTAFSYLSGNFGKELAEVFSRYCISPADIMNILHPIEDYDYMGYMHIGKLLCISGDIIKAFDVTDQGYRYSVAKNYGRQSAIYAVQLIHYAYRAMSVEEAERIAKEIISNLEALNVKSNDVIVNIAIKTCELYFTRVRNRRFSTAIGEWKDKLESADDIELLILEEKVINNRLN